MTVFISMNGAIERVNGRIRRRINLTTDRLGQILKRPTWHSEILFALLKMTWGVWLLVPWWDTFGSAGGYRVMASIAPEWVWGLAMFSAGYMHILSLGMRWARLRRIILLFAFWFWVFIAVMIGQSNIMGTGAPTYMAIALHALIRYLYNPAVENMP